MYYKHSYNKGTYHLNASVNMLMFVVKEQGVLGVVLDAADTLWLSLWVIIIARFEVLIILCLVVGHIATRRGLNYL